MVEMVMSGFNGQGDSRRGWESRRVLLNQAACASTPETLVVIHVSEQNRDLDRTLVINVQNLMIVGIHSKIF